MNRHRAPLAFRFCCFRWRLLHSQLSLFSAAAPSRLVIGYASTTPRLMPLWVARDQGFFAKYGIESEPVLLRSGATLVTGMASGDIQIGRTAGAAVLSAVAAGHDIKMLATFSSRNSYDVVARPNIKKPEDLARQKTCHQ